MLFNVCFYLKYKLKYIPIQATQEESSQLTLFHPSGLLWRLVWWLKSGVNKVLRQHFVQKVVWRRTLLYSLVQRLSNPVMSGSSETETTPHKKGHTGWKAY